MLSNLYVDAIANDAILGKTFTKKTNLFAEKGVGGKYAVVLENNADILNRPINELRESNMQILIVGYDILDGRYLAELIFALIDTVTGSQTYTDGKNGTTETYSFRSVTKKPPVKIQYKGEVGFSINFSANYFFSINYV